MDLAEDITQTNTVAYFARFVSDKEKSLQHYHQVLMLSNFFSPNL
jgi:hypothetical protein